MELKGKTIIITGGTRGIGRALATQALAQGAKIIATGASKASVEAAAKEMPEIEWHDANYSSTEDRKALGEIIIKAKPDIIIFNAGIFEKRDFTTPEAEEKNPPIWLEVQVNLTTPMELTRQILPSLAHEKPLQICYISSGLALVPQASAAVYCATKAGLHAFAKGLRGQLRKTAPQVKIIEALPPLVDTDGTHAPSPAQPCA